MRGSEAVGDEFGCQSGDCMLREIGHGASHAPIVLDAKTPVMIWRMTKDGIFRPVEIMSTTWRHPWAETADIGHGRTNLSQKPRCA